MDISNTYKFYQPIKKDASILPPVVISEKQKPVFKGHPQPNRDIFVKS